MARSVPVFFVALVIAQPATLPISIHDVDGKSWVLLAPKGNQLDLLLFVTTDCPISNRYIPEIRRICRDYGARGVRCFAVYPDAGADVSSVKQHQHEYGLGATIPAIIDRNHALVDAVGPRVTPEAVIYTSGGRVYRGRIDDLYIDVGRARREATHHDVRLALDATLAGRSISQPETEAIGCSIPKP